MRFKDVTAENPSIVASCRNNVYGPETVRVYEKDSTMIIYSFNDRVKHSSISNTDRKVKDSEIDYAIRKIMKVNPSKITGYISRNGIYHLHYTPAD